MGLVSRPNSGEDREGDDVLRAGHQAAGGGESVRLMSVVLRSSYWYFCHWAFLRARVSQRSFARFVRSPMVGVRVRDKIG